ncbi:type II toxin-antitoxin system RelE/ParE family toxin [Hominifimenecus sp. rT4P-3]|uniref:type II toxin-antitoxin system RelE/ParE family toxin n=1 Tax=Hominifimenecus sp. rT4P-3 TaxID=3242979 RepID=UPI003DA59923
MRYEVKLTPQAVAQIQETVSYITYTLLEAETARHWSDFLQKQISALDSMPARYPLTEEEPWRTYGIRKMTVKNFFVYYLIDEEKKIVSVTAVIYRRRDQLMALLDINLS